MKKRRICSFFFIVCVTINCYVGTQRDACRYNAKKDTFESCRYLGVQIGYANTRKSEDFSNEINYLLLDCLKYMEKMKNCDEGYKRYIPGIYGMNRIGIPEKDGFFSFGMDSFLYNPRRYGIEDWRS